MMCQRLFGRLLLCKTNNKGPSYDRSGSPHTIAAQQKNASPFSTL